MSSQSYDEFVDQYRAKLERLDNSGGTVETYLRVVQILFRLMDLHGVALADLTPDLAAPSWSSVRPIGANKQPTTPSSRVALLPYRKPPRAATAQMIRCWPSWKHSDRRAWLRTDG
jgi:hypothetical protein